VICALRLSTNVLKTVSWIEQRDSERTFTVVVMGQAPLALDWTVSTVSRTFCWMAACQISRSSGSAWMRWSVRSTLQVRGSSYLHGGIDGLLSFVRELNLARHLVDGLSEIPSRPLTWYAGRLRRRRTLQRCALFAIFSSWVAFRRRRLRKR
jgi:hypothetical protein